MPDISDKKIKKAIAAIKHLEIDKLIKISKTQINGAEINSVNVRDIYHHLEVGTQFPMWIPRI